MADYKDIAGRIRTTASDGVSVEAQEILDISKNKKQSQINAETDTTLANHASAIQGLNSQNYGTYTATDQTTAETDVLPAEGSEDTIYRLGNWDGTQYDVTCYSEYSWNGSAYVHISTKPQIGEVFDISAYHASGGTLATYSDLNDALNGTNGGIPQSLQKGGMSVKFVHTSDNKYVQYRLMSDSFNTTPSNWQGVDDVPTGGSGNMVKSGGAYAMIKAVENAGKQELSVLSSKTVGEEYSKNGFRRIDIYSDLLKKDSEIRIKIISCDSESVIINSFAFYGDGQSDYDNIGEYTSLGQTKVVKLQKDYKFLRFYNNIDDSDFSILFEIDSLSLEVERNQDDIKRLLSTMQLSSGEIYTQTFRNLEIVSDFLKKGNVLDLSLLYAKSSSISFGIYAFYGDGSGDYDTIGFFNSDNTQISKVLDKDYKKIRIYNNINDSEEFSVNFLVSNLKIIGNHETEIDDINTEIDDINAEIADINTFINGGEFEAINERLIVIPSSFLKQGNTLSVELLECKSSRVEIACFLFYSDNEYDRVQTFNKIGQQNYIKLNRDYEFIKFYNNVDSLGYTVRIRYENQSEETEFKVLILGNSYSQGGNWVRGMQEWLNIKSLVNLGVGSATVRDKYQDRITYPYTSRPVSTNGSGNLNTLACQVEKLKRLMQGTDLDPDEVQIYTSESEYPNIIIIEGGMNDTYDNEEKEQTYFSQFEKKVDNVYLKQKSTLELTQGSCYIKTPIEETDRTCFAGAYRYIVEELLNIFPKAQIFITTASGLGYWNNSVVERRYRIAEQQRKCANLCAANIIDWSAEGQISAILTYPQGSGTELDPYIWAECTLPNADSADLMHPNVKGGEKYGHLAALVIKQRFLDIENM